MCKAYNGGDTEIIFQAHQQSEATPFSSLLGPREQFHEILMSRKKASLDLHIQLCFCLSFLFSLESPKYQNSINATYQYLTDTNEPFCKFASAVPSPSFIWG
jgi:hypothetical protein